MTSNLIFFNIGKTMVYLTDQKDLLYYPKDVSRDILESFWNLDSVLKLYCEYIWLMRKSNPLRRILGQKLEEV